MPLPIKSIPVLTGKVAAEFIANADYNYAKKKATIDFSKQVAEAKKILAKAKV